MRRLILLAILFLVPSCLAGGMEEGANDVLFDLYNDQIFTRYGQPLLKYQEKISILNSEIDNIDPSLVNFFQDEKINVVISFYGSEQRTIGIRTYNGKVTTLVKNGFTQPTMIIATNDEKIRDLSRSSNPQQDLLNNISSGEIEIKQTGLRGLFGNFVFYLIRQIANVLDLTLPA